MEIVGRQAFDAETDALAEDEGRDQPGDPGIDVHNRAAGEVEYAGLAQETAAPYPVGDRRVDDDDPETDEDQERRELEAIDDGAGYQRRGDDGEGHLKGHENRFGNRAGERVGCHTDQEHTVESADEGVALGKGEAVADDHPQHRDDAGDGEALHDRVEHVFLAYHSAVKQRQARDGHQQHQGGRGQHPRGVAAVERRRRALGQRRPGHEPTPGDDSADPQAPHQLAQSGPKECHGLDPSSLARPARQPCRGAPGAPTAFSSRSVPPPERSGGCEKRRIRWPSATEVATGRGTDAYSLGDWPKCDRIVGR